MKKEIDNLLARYFGGNTTEQDMLDLEKWISSSSENQSYFDQLTNLYAKLGNLETNIPAPNTEQAKKSFMAYISMQKGISATTIKESSNKPFFGRWMYLAASIALILTLSITALLIFNSEHQVVLATQMTLKQDVLPDQTQIKLDKNSKITYSSNYGKKNRNIKLEGKAFFSVGHKGNGTLKITADETYIEDIGTQFTVSAYPDSNKVSVNVKEGKIHFFTTKNSGLVLTANETGIYNKQTKEFAVLKLHKDTVVKDLKHIQFNGISLLNAMKIIGKQYGVIILFDQPSIEEREITVNFDGENVEMVLQVIAETLNLDVKKIPTGYLLSNSKKATKQ